MGSSQIESGKFEKVPGQPPTVRVTDFAKLMEELKALKARSHTLDLQRLEESQKAELDQAMKAAEKRARGGPDLLKAQAEERRIAESKHQNDKELLAAKFLKLDQSLLALGQFLQTVGPLRDLESRLVEKEQDLRKLEEDLNVQRKVFTRERDELEAEKGLLQAAEAKLSEREREIQARLANLDVVKRAQELDALKEEMDSKLKAYSEQEARLEKQREELNRDFDKLGEARADIDRVVEGLEAERATLNQQKSKMAETAAKEFAANIEAFLRDMFKESAAKTPAPAPAPTAAIKQPKSVPAIAPPPARKSGANPWAELPP